MKPFIDLPDMGKDYVKVDYVKNCLVIRSEEKEIDLVFELDREIVFSSENIKTFRVDGNILTLYNDTDYEQKAAHIMGDKLVYLDKHAIVKNWFVMGFVVSSADVDKYAPDGSSICNIDLEVLVNKLVKVMPELSEEAEDLKRSLSYIDDWQLNKDIFKSIDNYARGEEVIEKFGDILVTNLYYNIYLPLKKE